MLKNNKLKLLMIVLILFLCSFFFKINNTFGIYKSNLSTTVNLSVLNPANNYVVTLDMNDGSGVTSTVYKNYNEQMGSDLISPTRSDYNFIGWYDANDRLINSSERITGNITFYAHWQKIVCKKVTSASNLHTETCETSSSKGCRLAGFSANSTITYGTVFGQNSPVAGDAYDCDVNNDGTYNGQTQYGKYSERFYFLRTIENGDDDTAALVYYTGYDTNGLVDSQHDSTINSGGYDTVLSWLPSSTSWDNPDLVSFGSKVSRFLEFADIEAACGSPLVVNDIHYFTTCGKWFLFENSRFQSDSYGRSGIWIEHNSGSYYRIHTASVNVASPDTGANSANTARPVIEIPVSALEGYVNAERYTISFNTHGGSSVENIHRYAGETLGNLIEPTREHFEFDGWYATFSNNEYSDLVSSSTIVSSDMTLHAKWTPLTTTTVTFNANGGTINGENTFDLTVDIGNAINAEDYPEATHATLSFDGWFTDAETTQAFNTSTLITGPLTLYAGWTDTNYVAMIGSTKYETLADAVAAVPLTNTKTRITILNDITLTQAISIPNRKWVELDGRNHTISGTVNLFANSGTLDIISGTFYETGNTTSSYIVKNYSTGILNISGGTLTFNNSNSSEAKPIENVGGTVNVTGGTISCNAKAAVINNKTTGVLNISGGRLIASNTTKGQVVYMDDARAVTNISGNVYMENVSNSTTDSRATVDNVGGTLTITGGTIVSKQYVAVETRGSAETLITTIGEDDDDISRISPVLRGKLFGLKRTAGTVNVYDGLFESLNNTTAVDGTIADKPSNFTDDTIDVEGVTYYSTYLLEAEYDVNFYPENGGSVETVSIENGSAIGASNMPNNPIKSGYYFDGWYDNDTQITSETIVTSDIDAYARWVSSVSNATISNTLSVVKGSTENIVITGSDIESVTYSSSDTSVATVNENGQVTGVKAGTATITITGSKSSDTRTVTVTVLPLMRTVTFKNSDETTVLYTRDIEDGSSFGQSMPANPTDTNYVFSAWYINGDSLAPFNASTVVTGDITVVANWKEKISYATLNIDPSPFEIVIGNTGQIDLEATDENGIVEDYTFVSSSSSIATVDANGEVTGVAVGSTNITITGSLSGAVLTVPVTVDVLKHTVTFKDGNDVLTTIRVEDGTAIGQLMPTNPEKTNYLFDAWYINGNSLYPVTNQTLVEDDIVAVASWTANIQLATIPATLSVTIGNTNTINITGPNVMESYTFTSSDSTIANVDSSGVVSGVSLGTTNVIITGSRSNTTRVVEVTVTNVPIRTVTFKDSDNTTVLYTCEVTDGSSLGELMPSNPTKQNYVFNTWYINGNNLTPFTSSTVVSGGDVVVIASWKATIGISSIDTDPDPFRIRLGETGQITIVGPNNSLVEDYTFSSSNTNIAYTNASGVVYTEDVGVVTITITGSVSGQTQTVEVIVHNNRFITFDPDNGEAVTIIEVEYGTSIDDANVTLPTDPTKTNSTFDRWYYYDGTDTTTTPLDTSKVITQDEVYKPRWASSSNIAAIGTTYYDTLTSAISAIPFDTENATEIRILRNASLTSSDSRPTVPKGKSVIFNGGKYTVECYHDNVIYNNGIARVISGTFTCGYDGKGPIENGPSGTLYIDGGFIRNTYNRGAVYNKGHVIMSGGELSSGATERSTINNVQKGASIEISGGTIIQSNSACNKGAVENYSGASITITGGTITSAAASGNVGGVQNTSGGTLIIGTQNGEHDVTKPIIRGARYGVYSPIAFTFYDGLLEGVTAATNQSTLTVETGANAVNNETELIDNATYKKLYYVIPQAKYRIIFESNDGEVSPEYKDFDLNTTINSSDLPTPTRALHTFDGWYTDEELTIPFTSFTPTSVSTVHYYAKWNFSSSTTAVPFRITSDAMNNYFNNVSSWITSDLTDTSNNNSDFENRHSLYKGNINSSFTTYGCSVCNGANTCTNPSSGTYCEQSRGYETGLTEKVDVYLYVNNAKGSLVTYTTSDNGIIYNMIPGVSYYWESHNDSSKYGVVTATGQRRTINSPVRNVRDLGGLAVDTNNDGTPDGTIKYGKLYRGAQIATNDGVDSLIKLGITREIDLRETGDNNAGTQPHFGDSTHLTNQNNVNLKYDIDLDDSSFTGTSVAASNGNIGYKDVVIRNYLINPTAVTGYYDEAHLNYYREFKKILKKTMQYAIDGDSIYFHCTIGTDRTGTLAYFLEGLLGVSLEDRIEDYELTYYFGLTNRHRFHNYLDGSAWNPRFYAMYMSYPNYDDIYNFYTFEREPDDDTLLANFKSAMIE